MLPSIKGDYKLFDTNEQEPNDQDDNLIDDNIILAFDKDLQQIFSTYIEINTINYIYLVFIIIKILHLRISRHYYQNIIQKRVVIHILSMILCSVSI